MLKPGVAARKRRTQLEMLLCACKGIRSECSSSSDVKIYLVEIDRLIHELDPEWAERDHNDYRAIYAHREEI